MRYERQNLMASQWLAHPTQPRMQQKLIAEEEQRWKAFSEETRSSSSGWPHACPHACQLHASAPARSHLSASTAYAAALKRPQRGSGIMARACRALGAQSARREQLTPRPRIWPKTLSCRRSYLHRGKAKARQPVV